MFYMLSAILSQIGSLMVRRFLNKLLFIFGYQIAKIKLGDRLKIKLNTKHPNAKFVQVGANDGTSFDNLYEFVTQNDWSGIAIEPLPDVFSRLSFNYSFYPKIKPLNLAVHPTEQDVIIYRVDEEYHSQVPHWAYGSASFIKENLTKSGLIKEEQLRAQKVRCEHLMSLVSLHGMCDAVYLQIDTEGFDANVIKMIDFKIWKPLLIKFEWVHLSDSEKEDVSILLKSNGYALCRDGIDMLAYQKF